MLKKVQPTLAIATCVAALTLAVFATLASSSTSPQLSQPQVHVNAKVLDLSSGRALLIRSLSILHDPDVTVRVDCGGCPRYRSKLPRVSAPNSQVTRYEQLGWIIRGGRRVQVLTVQPGAIGRYLLLGLKRPLGPHSLVVVAEGCLNGERQRAQCPPEATGDPIIPQQVTFEETAGGETHTHSDYASGSGMEGAVLRPGQTVRVTCRIEGLPVEDKNPWWYRIASSPWNNDYYASADAFYNNGETTGSLLGTPFYDPKVPIC